jgi:tryptophan halogenase
MWTLARAMDAGWMFRLPVWGRYGNGYIYDSNYIDADGAKKEVEKLFGTELDIGKSFSFDPGHVDRAWIKNCVAIGLSGSFVEPMEATSIGSSIQQAFMLMHRLTNYTDNVVHAYNDSFVSMMENIRDFVVLHYITSKNDTSFWQDLKLGDIPNSLGYKLERWRYKLPVHEDFNDTSDYGMFNADNFTLVLDGLNLFDRNAIRNEYEINHDHIKDSATIAIQNQIDYENSLDTIPHKEMLRLIREYF